MSVITIVGSGIMGSAMAFPASDNRHKVRLVRTLLGRGIDIDEAVKILDGVTRIKRRYKGCYKSA